MADTHFTLFNSIIFLVGILISAELYELRVKNDMGGGMRDSSNLDPLNTCMSSTAAPPIIHSQLSPSSSSEAFMSLTLNLPQRTESSSEVSLTSEVWLIIACVLKELRPKGPFRKNEWQGSLRKLCGTMCS